MGLFAPQIQGSQGLGFIYVISTIANVTIDNSTPNCFVVIFLPKSVGL